MREKQCNSSLAFTVEVTKSECPPPPLSNRLFSNLKKERGRREKCGKRRVFPIEFFSERKELFAFLWGFGQTEGGKKVFFSPPKVKFACIFAKVTLFLGKKFLTTLYVSQCHKTNKRRTCIS